MVLAVLGVASAVTVGLSGAVAYGSCAAESQRSANAFTGTVLSVASDGRVATVRTDEGTTVQVIGGPEGGNVTSVDRTYQVGVRYEFHPVNDHTPYRDNICTATHPLRDQSVPKRPDGATPDGAGTSAGQSTSGGSAAEGGGPQTDGPGEPAATTLAVLGIAVLGMVGSYLLLKRRSVSSA